ncbi:MAG: Asp/Glu racemase [Planktomarina sp.]|jgi:maleate isomerase|nr:Asp/Glu racemase [Planktomarina sp.]MDT2057759.1 Asp/Glu racemase [Planktomarina sp.]
MSLFSYTAVSIEPTRIGIIVLQSDETIERDLMAMRGDADVFVSRVPSGQEVTAETLESMAGHIAASASLFPQTISFDAVGYGCTSGTAQIGVSEIERLVKFGTQTKTVSQPVSALVAACEHLGLKRIAFLSPYIEGVSANLRQVLQDNGVETPAFGTFGEAEELKVVRISGASVMEAATALVRDSKVDGIFLSCTNLRTLDLIMPLEAALDMPVLSSNLVLAWHLAQLSGNPEALSGPGRLFASAS